ncbi:unnamed protein product [Clavelina lepadiformis]|uniref:CUB domain-containing protein n=1 Tax=Clavelina lepadiformis TaxID=159417 RepID=A0ABP0FW51_CLALP
MSSVAITIISLMCFVSPFAAGEQCTATTLDAEEIVKTIMYSSNHSDILDCQWTIKAPFGYQVLFTVSGFDTQSCCHYLTVKDGLLTLGRISEELREEVPFVSSSGSLVIRFHSDHSSSTSMFQGTYVQANNCGSNLNVSIATLNFSTPGYPGNYPKDLDCYWQLRPAYHDGMVILAIYEADVSYGDFIDVFDDLIKLERLSWRTRTGFPRSYQSDANNLVVYFHSDTTRHPRHKNSGFRAVASSCLFSLTANATDQTIATPNYPGTYGNNLFCAWTISASQDMQVFLTITDFDSQACCDYVKVSDGFDTIGFFNGSSRSDVSMSSEHGKLVVEFYSDASDVGTGFQATFREASNCGTYLSVGHVVDYFYTPNYLNSRTQNYPNNLDCYWKLQAGHNQRIQLTFLKGRTEACCDYAEISEMSKRRARVRGLIKSPRSFISNGNTMAVYFHSDSQRRREGFLVSYVALRNDFDSNTCKHALPAKTNDQILSSAPLKENGDCHWTIYPAKGYQVLIRFTSIDMAPEYDYIEVTDDSSSTSIRLTGTTSTEIPFVTRGNGNLIIQGHYEITHNRGPAFTATYRLAKNCGENVEVSYDGTFSFPSDDDSYSYNLDCYWLLKAEKDYEKVVLSISEGETEECCDYIDVFDGMTRLTRISGKITKTPASFISTKDSLVVYFHSDGKGSGKVFRAAYDKLWCGFTTYASTNPQILMSPGYPKKYGRYYACSWIIIPSPESQILLTVTSDDTTSCCTSYTVEDDIGNLESVVDTVTENKQYISRNGSVVVWLTSDGVSGPVFYAVYKQIAFNCGEMLDVDFRTQSISTPQFPLRYRNNLGCFWKLTAQGTSKIQLTLFGKMTEPCCDYIEISSTSEDVLRIKGRIKLPTFFLSSGNTMKIYFHSDHQIVHAGFRATYRIRPKGLCGFIRTARKVSQVISSPHFFSGRSPCRWTITAQTGFRVILLLQAWGIRSCCSLEVIGGQFDSIKIDRNIDRFPIFSSVDGKLEIEFVYNSAFVGENSGFWGTYRSVSSCGENLTAIFSYINQFSSPNYPTGYANNLDCFWKVTARDKDRQIRLSVLKTDPEPSNDYVEVFDGLTRLAKLKGKIDLPETFISSGQDLVVYFHSDGSISRTGFLASYVQTECGEFVKLSGGGVGITSPNYPSRSERYRFCDYYLMAPAEFYQIEARLDVDTDTTCDYVEIVDIVKLGRLEGNVSNAVAVSSGPKLLIRYHTCGAGFSKGFTAEITLKVKHSCGFTKTALASPRIFVSPYSNYGQHNGIDCDYFIKAPSKKQVVLKINQLLVEPEFCCDSVEVYDGLLQIGKVSELLPSDITVVSSGGQLRVRLYTEGRNFSATYVQGNNCGKELIASNNRTFLSSLQYTNESLDTYDCMWTIRSVDALQVRLHITNIQTNLCCSYVQVLDGLKSLGKLQGNSTELQTYTSDSDTLRIYFHRAGIDAADYFTARFEQACDRSFSVKYSFRTTIQSPNFPQHSPHNMDCYYEFLTDPDSLIQLNLDLFETQECCDYLEIFDNGKSVGRFQGEIPRQSFTSTADNLRLHYHTDSTGASVGFRITYRKIKAS